MSTSVLARVLRKNQYSYPLDCVHQEAINCASAKVVGSGWFTPNIERGRFVDYNTSLQSAKPRVDAVKVVIVVDGVTGTKYYIAQPDADAAQLFNDKCNACCDAVTPMNAVTMPDPMIEELMCYNAATSKYETISIAVALAAGQAYKPKGSFDGAYMTPATPGAGFATPALFVTWANTNWSAYGTWTSVGNVVKLANNAVHRAWIDMNPSL